MQNPVTPDEIHQKYLKLATTVTTAAHAEEIAEIVGRIERLSDLTRFVSLLRSLKPPTAKERSGAARRLHSKTKRSA